MERRVRIGIQLWNVVAPVLALKAEGVGPAEISRRLGIARSSVYRMLEAGGEA